MNAIEYAIARVFAQLREEVDTQGLNPDETWVLAEIAQPCVERYEQEGK